MPISEAQLNANRENSKLSTGPKSPEGKAKLRLNPLTHGFAGQTVVIPDHQKEDYLKLFKSFRTEFNPQGPSEQFLVQSLAEISWSVQQIRAASPIAQPNRLIVSLADKALGRDGRMLRALDEMGPGSMLVEGRPFHIDLD